MENNATKISISEFKATCLKVLDHVKKTGKQVIVTRRGKPVALVSPPPPPDKDDSWIGRFREQGEITGDIISPVVDGEEWEVFQK